MSSVVNLLLIARDESLIGTIEAAIRPRPDLRLGVAPDVDEALVRTRRGEIGLLLIHQGKGEDATGAARLIRGVAAAGLAVPTVVLSDRHGAEDALMLLRLGAVECLTRPLDLNRLTYLADVLTLRARYAAPRPAAPGHAANLVRESVDGAPFLYLADNAMGRMMERVRRIAPRDATVLLGGETGTGKTRLAALIHGLSNRRDEPFLVVNCGALSATLIESEMFGHARGAFTGADRDRVGKFQEAGRGTILLDEVDLLPPSLQAKLLRVTEERLFEPVGSNRSLPMRARLIVASNRSLQEEVAAGRFRSDLYYRLNVVSFEVPPLRERAGIIPHLANQMVSDFAARSGQPAPALDAAALRSLEAHDWPGNIRELRNVIERAVALCDGARITPDDLPDSLPSPGLAVAPGPAPAGPAPRTTSGTLAESKESAELSRILDALDKHSNNRLRAAAELGISRMTLYKKLHKYNMMAGLKAIVA